MVVLLTTSSTYQSQWGGMHSRTANWLFWNLSTSWCYNLGHWHYHCSRHLGQRKTDAGRQSWRGGDEMIMRQLSRAGGPGQMVQVVRHEGGPVQLVAAPPGCWNMPCGGRLGVSCPFMSTCPGFRHLCQELRGTENEGNLNSAHRLRFTTGLWIIVKCVASWLTVRYLYRHNTTLQDEHIWNQIHYRMNSSRCRNIKYSGVSPSRWAKSDAGL